MSSNPLPTKEEARALVAQHLDKPEEAPYICLYESWGKMADIRLYFRIEDNEIHFYGYRFHILPKGNRVADARSTHHLTTPQLVGWCQLKDRDWAKEHVYMKEG